MYDTETSKAYNHKLTEALLELLPQLTKKRKHLKCWDIAYNYSVFLQITHYLFVIIFNVTGDS